MKKIATIFLFSLVIAACGSSDDDEAVDAGNNPTFDAGNNPTFDAPPQANCLAANDLGSPTLVNEGGQFCGTIDVPTFFTYVGGVNADAQPDVLGLELYANFGAFAGGPIATGTYPITGDELNYASCGVCVRLLTDFTGSAFADDGYMATAGSVTITSINPLAATVSGIAFEHVTIDANNNFTSTAHADGCTSALTAATLAPAAATEAMGCP